MKRIHGGDWASFREKTGRLPLDFSANTSPLGLPERVRKAAADSLREADRYPDPECRTLRRALAGRYGLAPEELLCGNGAADLVDRLALALRPRKALVTAPAFTEYRSALERVGCEVQTYELPEAADFRLDERFPDSLTDDLDAVILCEPNNPTGQTTDRALLEAIASRCDEQDILLVLDECFSDFLDEPSVHSFLPEIRRHRVLVLRAFTKFYGMAGLRLGWCACADRGLLEHMAEAGQPWPVSVPAQAAGIAALQEAEYEQRLRTLVQGERPRLRRALEGLGCRVIPGEANFLLFRDDTPALPERLEKLGVLIRNCAEYEGLGAGWYRIAVRTPAENGVLIEAMKEARR